jgi:hypothetical protein
MDISSEELFNQLREMVAVLAAPADDQIRYITSGRPVPVDELYLQLDDSVPSWFPRLRHHHLIDDQAEVALLGLLHELERMRNTEDLSLWEDDALYHRQEWGQVRNLAESALDFMGPPKEVPSGPPVPG